MIKNLVLHFNLVNRHRFKVFKLCCKAGIPFRGIVHDLSKYSPVEFFESVKYYDGGKSPISNCKKEFSRFVTSEVMGLINETTDFEKALKDRTFLWETEDCRCLALRKGSQGQIHRSLALL